MKTKKNLVTTEKANRVNWKRFDKEHNLIFPSMLTELKSLKLRRISTITGYRNNNESNEVDENKYYLVGYNGTWKVSKAYKYHGGWEFDIGHYHTGLGMVDFLFEISNLEEYENKPLGRLQSDYDEYGDLIREE